jgi:hypothetical protein
MQSALLSPAATCKVEVAGTEISQLYPVLGEVTVDARRGQATTAELRFHGMRDQYGNWNVQDAGGQFLPWQPVTISAVFASSTQEVLRGYVRDIAAEHPEDQGQATVVVSCQDESLALDRMHQRRVWGGDAPTTDLAIVQQVLGDYGLSLQQTTPAPDAGGPGAGATADPGPGLQGIVVYQDSTDARLLRDRAEINGLELLFESGTVYFGRPRLEAVPQGRINVYAGASTNCVSLSVRADGHMPDTVGYDLLDTGTAGNGSASPASARTLVTSNLPPLGPQPATSAGAGLQDFVWLLSREGGRDPAELAALAQAKANDASMKVRADGEVDGSIYGQVMQVAQPIEVDGVGSTFSGTYYVDAVNHRFNDQGYRQRFTLLRNAYGDNLSATPLSTAGGAGVLAV